MGIFGIYIDCKRTFSSFLILLIISHRTHDYSFDKTLVIFKHIQKVAGYYGNYPNGFLC